ncbi:MAG: exported protein of unknown function [Nitrospira sp.]|jgi:hypothetical protein|nr:exported protein of unknown function [Nitrospira sp.]
MMRFTSLILLGCLAAACFPNQALASTDDVGAIIENFVTTHFPDAASHFWVVNETQWDGDEMVVDVAAIVTDRRQAEPTASRFLLLIVAGNLQGSQSIPLDAATECKQEQEV